MGETEPEGAHGPHGFGVDGRKSQESLLEEPTMHDSTTSRRPKRSSLIALGAIVIGCALLQGSATLWSTMLLVLGCALAYSVGWTARAASASRSEASTAPQSLRLVGREATEDSVTRAQAAMEQAEASERAMQTTLADLDRVIESVGELCVTLDGELEQQPEGEETRPAQARLIQVLARRAASSFWQRSSIARAMWARSWDRTASRRARRTCGPRGGASASCTTRATRSA